MNVNGISRYVGLALLVSAIFMALSLVVSVVEGVDSGFIPLLVAFLLTASVGAFPFIFVDKNQNLSLLDGYLVIVLAWILSFIFGMIPYSLLGGQFTLTNAWFESVSGFTTTGATILEDIEVLPKSILFWRASTHFIGGLGVVVFILMVLPESSNLRFKLLNLELSTLSKDAYHTRNKQLLKIIIGVYLSLVILLTGLLCLAGMPFFDSITHAFSTIATGGFSIKNASIGYYDSQWINAIILVFMFISSLHFALVYASVATGSLKPLNTPVIRYYVTSLLVFVFFCAFSLHFGSTQYPVGQAVMEGLFGVVSYITTTGFSIADNSCWPPLACTVLVLATIQCACAGSTSGGVKADRVFILLKALGFEVRKHTSPSRISSIRVGRHIVEDSVVRATAMYLFLYVIISAVSILMLLMMNVSLNEAFSGTLASVSNVGPGLGSIGSSGNYSHCLDAAKNIYTADMILGRLEIFPVFSVIAMIFSRQK